MTLPFNIEMQLKSRWCWAATSKSVSSFYISGSIWTQCSIASAELVLKCCNTPFPPDCDKDWYLDRALNRTGNFDRIDTPVSWNAVEQEINNGRVLGARIGWAGGGGHFMIIHGTTTINELNYLHIDDPISGKSMVTYNQFLNNYEDNGRWTHTYFTKTGSPQGGGDIMRLKLIDINPQLLNPIRDFENDWLLQSDKDKFEFFDTDTATTNIPHYSYIVRLDQLKDQKGFPDSPGSLRIFKLSNFRPTALYELSIDQAKPELLKTSTNQKYFKQLENSIRTLQNDTADGSNELGELRLLKLPSLNTEAFWVHYNTNENNDTISPIRKFDSDNRFDWNRLYKKDEFWALARGYAAKVETDDELLGG